MESEEKLRKIWVVTLEDHVGDCVNSVCHILMFDCKQLLSLTPDSSSASALTWAL